MIENKIAIGFFQSWAGLAQIIQVVNYFRLLFFIGLGIGLSVLVHVYGLAKPTNLAYQYRFWISGVLLMVLVLFEIHGSSILYWQNYLSNLTTVYEPLIGISRGIRSDEWAVNTPMMLSQYYNNSGLFPLFQRNYPGDINGYLYYLWATGTRYCDIVSTVSLGLFIVSTGKRVIIFLDWTRDCIIPGFI